MNSHQLHTKIREYIKILQHFVDRIWYAPLIGFLAAIDNFIILIPTDGLLISSSMLIPKKWFALALNVAVGSAIGALVLATLVAIYGMPLILEIYPGINETTVWTWTMKFFDSYGLLLVFAMAVTPLVQQPAVILASLSGTPIFKLVAVIFFGRFIKYLIMSYIGSHAPKLLTKMWGLKGELTDVGVKLK